MRSIFTWLIIFILIVLAARIAGTQYVSDEILVKFKAGVNRAKINNFNIESGVLDVIEKIGGYKVLKIPSSKSVPEMVARYNKNPDVEWAEANNIYHPLAVPNDSSYCYQGYYNVVKAESGWDVEVGDPNVIIAIVDSGVYIDHPDLTNKIWTNADEAMGDEGVDDDENGYIDDIWGWDFFDNDNYPNVENCAHGTEIAGIAAAETNNGEGIAGTAWNCPIMVVRVGNFEGEDADATASGIRYAADNGANVINLSLGDYTPSNALKEAIDYAHDEKGCVIVAAAGNDNSSPIVYPARYSKVIAVGATGGIDLYKRLPSSNWGTDDRPVDVVAPGQSMTSTSVKFDKDGNPKPTYHGGSGTSFAAPIVSGLAALIISYTGITDPEMVRDYIKDGALDLPDDPDDAPDAGPNWDGSGMVQFTFINSFFDVSGDGKVTVYDSSLVFQHINGVITLKESQKHRGDVNGDDFLSVEDAKLILKKVVGLIK